ncbi:unnamed protein product [Nesidiocoris tenuis]|uniref:Uncharacterized protein n=1 Tax=Nesidiocoris tenuis TaxID=355587 RepID=A0A6H5HLD2_9HEMI|nr:unnamed protein product [Nesidiocoris tenuis]
MPKVRVMPEVRKLTSSICCRRRPTSRGLYSRLHPSRSPLRLRSLRSVWWRRTLRRPRRLRAAHGLCSILQMLLCCESYLEKNKEAEKLIKKSVDFLVSIQTPGGNFPCDFAEIGSSASVMREDLVHWCHGAPG